MKTILEDNISYDTKIKDFGVDSVNKRIITTGDKLIFSKEGKIEKEIAGKIKNCELGIDNAIAEINLEYQD